MSMKFDLFEEDNFPKLTDYKYIEETDFYKLYYNYVLQKQFGKRVLKDEYLRKQVLKTFNGFITFNNYLRNHDTYGARRYIEMFLLNNRDLQECKDENMINIINKMYDWERIIKRLEKTDDGQYKLLDDMYERFNNDMDLYGRESNGIANAKEIKEEFDKITNKYQQEILTTIKNENVKSKLIEILSRNVDVELSYDDVCEEINSICCDFLNESVSLKLEYYHYNELLRQVEEFTKELENKRWLHRDFGRYANLDKVYCLWNNDENKEQMIKAFNEYNFQNKNAVVDLCKNLGGLWVYLNDRCIKCDFIGLKKYIVDFIENNNELYETIINEFNELRNKNEKWYIDNLGVKSYDELLNLINVQKEYGSSEEIIEFNSYIDEIGEEEAEEYGCEKIDVDIDIFDKFVNKFSLSAEYKKLMVLKTICEDFNILNELVNIEDDFEMIDKHLYKIIFKDDDFVYDYFYISYFIENKVKDEIYLLEFDEDEEEW